MRKLLIFAAAALALSTPALATYFVVMKDGSQYRAKGRPVVAKNVATFQLDSGQTLRVDANSIDFTKSDQATKLGGGEIIGVDQTQTTQSQQSSLGAAFKLHKLPSADQVQSAPTAGTTGTTAATVSGPVLSDEVLKKFELAYENVGIFEHKATATGLHSLRAEVTVDNEEKVFNAISATSFLMVRNAGVPGTQIDMVELFMKTTTGGAAGRFQMSRDDAQALDAKSVTREEYFVHKVLY